TIVIGKSIHYGIMLTTLLFLAALPAAAQVVRNFQPVTQAMLLNPSPDDWLMYSRTYDAQRFSPLKQINKQNVGQLRMAWVRGFGRGASGPIPVGHGGVIYVVTPGAVVQALDGVNGDLLWEYKRPLPQGVAAATART